MKQKGEIIRNPQRGELRCLICDGNLWKHRVTKNNKREKYRCINGCMDFDPARLTELKRPEFEADLPF